MRTALLALLVCLGVSHSWRAARPVPRLSVIGVAVFAARVEGRAFIVERLPDGECRVVFGGEGQLPLDPASICRL